MNGMEYHVELFGGKQSQLVAVNEEKPSLKIVKTDVLTGEPLAGVGFLVKKAEGETENTVVTDENDEEILKTFYVEYGETSSITWYTDGQNVSGGNVNSTEFGGNAGGVNIGGTNVSGSTQRYYDNSNPEYFEQNNTEHSFEKRSNRFINVQGKTEMTQRRINH